MARHTDPDLLNHVLQLLTDQGHDGFAEGLRILVNEAMRVERHQVLQAQPYERTDTRQGYANGYKPKTLTSRVGPITFSVPQVRGETSFYPSALEKGIRSEQALKLAMAEMYVQGVSTRKVSAIVEELCGASVSSAQVSACAQLLDAELHKWRERSLDAFPYLILDARYEKVRGWINGPKSPAPSAASLSAPAAPPLTCASRRSSRTTPRARPNSPLGWRKTCRWASPSLPCRSATRNGCAPLTRWNG
jgi:hypothetical protein